MTMTSNKQVRKERKGGNILFLSIYRDFSKGTFSGSSPRRSRKGSVLREENKVKKTFSGVPGWFHQYSVQLSI